MFKHYDDFYGWTQQYQHSIMCNRKTLILYTNLSSHMHHSIVQYMVDELFSTMGFHHFLRNVNGCDQYRNQLMIKMPYNYAFTLPDGAWRPVII